MCWVGCLATKYCGFLIGLLNTLVLIGYFYGLFVECGSGCYRDEDHPDRLPLATAIVGPGTCFFFGFLLALIALKRSDSVIDGCHHIIVVIWLLLLGASCVLCAWNCWNMIHYEIGDGGLAIYDDMVYAVIIWNLLLLLLSCNIMIRADDDNLKRGPMSMIGATNYQSVEEDAFDHEHQNSFHEL